MLFSLLLQKVQVPGNPQSPCSLIFFPFTRLLLVLFIHHQRNKNKNSAFSLKKKKKKWETHKVTKNRHSVNSRPLFLLSGQLTDHRRNYSNRKQYIQSGLCWKLCQRATFPTTPFQELPLCGEGLGRRGCLRRGEVGWVGLGCGEDASFINTD